MTPNNPWSIIEYWKNDSEHKQFVLNLVLMLSLTALILGILMLCGCSGGLHVENDLFQRGITSDQYYTHGTKFSYFKETEHEKETFSIGQNIYTPSTKKLDADPAILRNDRPFAGWLYGEYRNTNLTSENIITTYGVQLGCTGPCSLAKQTQRQVHRWLDQSIPSWRNDFTHKSEVGVILEAERGYRFYSKEYFDLTGYGAAKVGNIVDSAAVGLDVRAGYNLDKFPSDPIIFKLPKAAPSNYLGYVFCRLEQRLVPYNHLLDGSLFQDERHRVHSELSVQEGDVGFTLGWKKLKFTYRYTVFSNEWKEKKGSFGFGGIDLAW